MLTPLKPLGTIDQIFELDCVYDKDARQVHIDAAVKSGVPWCVRRPPRDGKVAIVASGPSATEAIDLLKEWDGEIWGVNGAFAWLVHRGVTPTAFVGLDPEPILKGYLINLPTNATYYLGAQVHPEVFEHLKGRNVRLWFPMDGQTKFPFGAVEIYGGTTCLGRAPNLAYLLGWREVHIFGCDSSFTERSHVYEEPGVLPAGAFPIEMHGKTFITTRQMLQQACDFAEQIVEWARPGADGDEPLSVSLYGDGLMQWMYAKTLETGNYHQYLREAYAQGLTRKERQAVRKAIKRQAA
jgi:hypothetical protein